VDAHVSHPISSPGTTVHGLITVFEASREAFGGRMALNLPGLNVKVSDMLAALEKVAGPAVRARVTFEKDERIAAIVDNWAKGCTFERAQALGLRADASYEAIIEQYIEDCKTRPGYPAEALNGLK
jgi:nucleoside-diphosphate-sugar epimerase